MTLLFCGLWLLLCRMGTYRDKEEGMLHFVYKHEWPSSSRWRFKSIKFFAYVWMTWLEHNQLF